MIKGVIGTVKTFENGVVRFNFEIPHEQAPDDSMRWAYKEAYLSLAPPEDAITKDEKLQQLITVLERFVGMEEVFKEMLQILKWEVK